MKYVNNLILIEASKLSYSVADKAPGTFGELKACSRLVVWSGGSDSTIFQDAKVNWAFRALHDSLHLKHNIGFSIPEEIELAKIHANMQSSSLLADLIYIEVAEQAKELLRTGSFVSNQIEFTHNKLNTLGWKVA